MNPNDILPTQYQTANHGGQVYAFAKQQQCSLSELIDFSASINPIQPKIDWQSLATQAQLELIHYPQEYCVKSPSSLKPLIAQRFSVQTHHVFLSNGISDAIGQLLQSLAPQHGLLFTPIYSEYLHAANLYCQHTIGTQLSPQDWLQTDAAKHLPAGSVLILVNPSTPQGTLYTTKELSELLHYCQKNSHWLMLDESFLPFISFSKQDSARQFLDSEKKLIILQSLTKFFACPGVRIGATFSNHPEFSQHLTHVWSISTLDRLWLTQAIQDTTHTEKTQQWLTTTKPRFLQQLKALPCVLRTFEGTANFILVEFNRPVEIIQKHLNAFKILIRNAESFGFSAYHARIAIKTSHDNQQLIAALEQLDD